MTRVCIVGAGILGASAAYHAARIGLDVTIIERDAPGAGTTGASFAWVNAQDKEPAAYFALNRAGVHAVPALAADLGGDWFHPGGDLLLGVGEAIERVRAKAGRHASNDYPVTVLERDGVASLEPGLALPDGPLIAAHFSAESWVDGPRLATALIDAAAAYAADLVTAEVVGFVRDDERVVGVRSSGGDEWLADIVVIAAGAASADLAAAAGIALPMAPSPGLLITTPPIEPSVRRVIHTGDVVLRPDGGGRVLVTSRAIDATLDPGVRTIAVHDGPVVEVLRRASAWLPALAGIDAERARIGIRSMPTDGKPAVGPVPGAPGLYLLVSHSGVTLAPVLGALVAQELGGATAVELHSYRPARFAA